MVCGVPASGKSWVCEQLKNEFHYVQHDLHKKTYPAVLVALAKLETAPRPILADCPYGERALRDTLQSVGIEVVPVFIVEDPMVVKERYEKRGKPQPKEMFTRSSSIADRAKEWGAFSGTSEQVLEHLKNVPRGTM